VDPGGFLMPRAQWPLLSGRPVISVVLTETTSRQQRTRTLLADTGAGGTLAKFELLLDENDCLLCGARTSSTTSLLGAYHGTWPLYLIPVEIPLLNFNRNVAAVGLPITSPGVDGIAGFRFLNRFTYGNFGNPAEFGLET
jgi:hypothetical protein